MPASTSARLGMVGFPGSPARVAVVMRTIALSKEGDASWRSALSLLERLRSYSDVERSGSCVWQGGGTTHCAITAPEVRGRGSAAYSATALKVIDEPTSPSTNFTNVNGVSSSTSLWRSEYRGYRPPRRRTDASTTSPSARRRIQ